MTQPDLARRSCAARVLALLAGGAFAGARAAPEEGALGAGLGYPIGSAATWTQPENLVGSVSNFGQIPGVWGGSAMVLDPSDDPMELERARSEAILRWRSPRGMEGVDGYLDRHPILALLVVRDRRVLVERYQYQRRADHRFLSNSMTKSITALGTAIAWSEGLIASLDARADQLEPLVQGTVLGQSSLRELLMMRTRANFSEHYEGLDDFSAYVTQLSGGGMVSAQRFIRLAGSLATPRQQYMTPAADMVGLVLARTTGVGLGNYVGSRLWKKVGAEHSATWRGDRYGLQRGGGGFSATARDWARLGMVLANGGRRPDRPRREAVVPGAFLKELETPRAIKSDFYPGALGGGWGYQHFFWSLPDRSTIAMMGVHGQSMFIDRESKTVMVQFAVDRHPLAERTLLGRERMALWEAVLDHVHQ